MELSLQSLLVVYINREMMEMFVQQLKSIGSFRGRNKLNFAGL